LERTNSFGHCSGLVDALVKQRADVPVVDNLSSGKTENLQHHVGGDNSLAKKTIREQGKSILPGIPIKK
jgi:hypothetical protein